MRRKRNLLRAAVTLLVALAVAVAVAPIAWAGNHDGESHPGQCPDGYVKVVDDYEDGMSWTADADYDSVILVGGPPEAEKNKDPDGRDKVFSDVEKGDTIAREAHDISHICGIVATPPPPPPPPPTTTSTTTPPPTTSTTAPPPTTTTTEQETTTTTEPPSTTTTTEQETTTTTEPPPTTTTTEQETTTTEPEPTTTTEPEVESEDEPVLPFTGPDISAGLLAAVAAGLLATGGFALRVARPF